MTTDLPGTAQPSALRVAALFTFLTVLCTWPLAWQMRTHVQDRGDPLLEIVALTWASQAVLTPDGALSEALLDAPQFYPYPDTALYQNSFFGQVPLFLPLWHLTGNPVFAFQGTLLAALVLSALCMWGCVRALTGQSWAGILAGACFALHQYRFRNLQHLQVMSIWWWPLALWGLESLLAARRRRGALLLLLSLAAQFYCSVYMGLMLVGIVLTRLLVEWATNPAARMDRGLRRRVAFALAGAAVAVTPLGLAYLRITQQFPPAHDLDAIAHFSAAPHDYLRLGLSSVPYHWWRARAPWQYTFDQFVLFPGALPLLLAVYGALATERWARTGAPAGRYMRRVAFAVMLAAVGAVILSLGPYLKHHGQPTEVPLPAYWLLRYVPGYSIFRVNTRFAFVLLFALSLGVGQAYRMLVERRSWGPRIRTACGITLLGLLVVENWNAPVPTEPVAVGDAIPEVYRALAEDPTGGPILEVPLGRDLYEDIERVYYGLAHGRRMVNGYSTVVPPGYAQWAAVTTEGPSPALWAALAAWDVRTIVVHYRDMTLGQAARWRTARDAPDITVWRTFADAEIWTLSTAPTVADALQANIRVPTLRAGGNATVDVVFDAARGTVWRCGDPLGLRDVTVTWQPSGAGPLVEQQVRALVPLFVVGARPERAEVMVPTPAQSGEYTLRLDYGVATAEARVIVTAAVSPRDGGA